MKDVICVMLKAFLSLHLKTQTGLGKSSRFFPPNSTCFWLAWLFDFWFTKQKMHSSFFCSFFKVTLTVPLHVIKHG